MKVVWALVKIIVQASLSRYMRRTHLHDIYHFKVIVTEILNTWSPDYKYDTHGIWHCVDVGSHILVYESSADEG